MAAAPVLGPGWSGSERECEAITASEAAIFQIAAQPRNLSIGREAAVRLVTLTVVLINAMSDKSLRLRPV